MTLASQSDVDQIMSLSWSTPTSYLEVKVDLIVNIPGRCAYLPVLLDNRMLAVLLDLSVDLHDVVGDIQVTYYTSAGDSTGMA